MNNIVLTELVLSGDDESIARLMVEHTGNLALVSRDPAVSMNAMTLRAHVRSTPNIRLRYQELLNDELVDSGLHISERILKMVKLQEIAFGDIENDVPADPKLVIELSKHISELIKEGKQINVSQKSAMVLSSKEDAVEMLKRFLKS